MTDEDYLRWLKGMVEHSRKMSASTELRPSCEYYGAALAYEKAYTVFKDDVMRRRAEKKEAKEKKPL